MSDEVVSMEELLTELGPDGPAVIQSLIDCGSLVGQCLHSCGGANVSMTLDVQFNSGIRKKVKLGISIEDAYDA